MPARAKVTGLGEQIVFAGFKIALGTAHDEEATLVVTSAANRSHRVRDVTFDEARSQVRVGHIPQVMAALRNTGIGVMRRVGEVTIAAACRRFAAQPSVALALLGMYPRTECPWPYPLTAIPS